MTAALARFVQGVGSNHGIHVMKLKIIFNFICQEAVALPPVRLRKKKRQILKLQASQSAPAWNKKSGNTEPNWTLSL